MHRNSAIFPLFVAIESSKAMDNRLCLRAKNALGEIISLLKRLDDAYEDICIKACVIGFSDDVEAVTDGFLDVGQILGLEICPSDADCLVMPLAEYLEKALADAASIDPERYVYPPAVIFMCATTPSDKAEFSRKFKDAAWSSSFGTDIDSSALARSVRAAVSIADFAQPEFEEKKRFSSYLDSLVGGDKDFVFGPDGIEKLLRMLFPLRPSARRVLEGVSDISELFSDDRDMSDESAKYCVQLSDSVLMLEDERLLITLADLTPCMPSEEDIPCFVLQKDAKSGRLALTNLCIDNARITMRISGKRTVKLDGEFKLEYENNGRVRIIDGAAVVDNTDPLGCVILKKSFEVGETVEVSEWDSVDLFSRELFEIQTCLDDMF